MAEGGAAATVAGGGGGGGAPRRDMRAELQAWRQARTGQRCPTRRVHAPAAGDENAGDNRQVPVHGGKPDRPCKPLLAPAARTPPPLPGPQPQPLLRPLAEHRGRSTQPSHPPLLGAATAAAPGPIPRALIAAAGSAAQATRTRSGGRALPPQLGLRTPDLHEDLNTLQHGAVWPEVEVSPATPFAEPFDDEAATLEACLDIYEDVAPLPQSPPPSPATPRGALAATHLEAERGGSFEPTALAAALAAALAGFSPPPPVQSAAAPAPAPPGPLAGDPEGRPVKLQPACSPTSLESPPAVCMPPW